VVERNNGYSMGKVYSKTTRLPGKGKVYLDWDVIPLLDV
jgi:hypothetical protein